MSKEPSIDVIFCEAIEIESAKERESFLEDVCGDHEQLRDQVNRLIHAHFHGGSVLDSPAAGIDATVELPVKERPGIEIGPYKLLQVIGEGGMGVVYMAEQNEPVKRRVALKIIKQGMDTQQVIARFEAERQALTMMDHPNIAKALDAGATENGRPYFVMELVKGLSITQYCDEQHLTPKERLRLFIPICQAVQHAHQKGIIHRDLKPGNVLIALYDGQAVPKVIDFGIAKATSQQLTEKTMFTQLGQVVGTLEYMSPEQAQVNQLDVDTRSDIYSLGVLLYELLTGVTPVERSRLRSSAFDEMMRIIREEEPPRPSLRLSTIDTLPAVAANRRTEPQKLRAFVRGDLDWIVMKSLEKDRNRRYDTAKGFANDIERHLSDEPILARPPTMSYRFQKAWRRNNVIASAGLAVAITLVAATGISTWQALVATGAKNEAERAEGRASDALTLAEQEKDRAVRSAADLRLQAYVSDVGVAHEAIRNGDLGRAQTLLQRHRPKAGEEDLRGFEWRFLWSRAQGSYTKDLGPYNAFLRGVAISPDGQFAALHRADPWPLDIIHLSSGSIVKTLESTGSPLKYSPSGNILVAHQEGNIVGFNTQTWERLPPLPVKFPMAFGHRTDNEIFVAVDGDQLALYSAAEWKRIGTLENRSRSGKLLAPGFGQSWHMTTTLSVSADDKTVYLAGGAGIRRWDLESRSELTPFTSKGGPPLVIQTGEREGFSCSATSGDGQLAVGDRWGQVHLIDPAVGNFIHTFDAHIGWVTTVRFSEDGNRLVSAGADRTITVYDPRKRTVVDRLLGHRRQVWGLDISANGEKVVSGAGHGDHAFLWSLKESDSSSLDSAAITRFAVLADSRIICRDDATFETVLYDPKTDQFESMWSEPPISVKEQRRIDPIAASPDARWFVSQDKRGERTIKVWNLLTGGQPRRLLAEAPGNARAAFSLDSQFLVIVGSSGSTGASSEVQLWRTEDWSMTVLCEARTAAIGGIAFSGNSKYLALSDTDGNRILVFDLQTDPVGSIFEKPGMNAWSVGLSTTGRWLAAGYTDNIVRVYDFKTKEWVAELEGHVNSAFSLSFSPDDRTLASSSFAGIKFWNVTTWQELISQEADAAPVFFSPDGRYLAVLATKTQPGTLLGSGFGLRLMKAPTLVEIDAISRARQAQITEQ